jgi:hypothetical protein
MSRSTEKSDIARLPLISSRPSVLETSIGYSDKTSDQIRAYLASVRATESELEERHVHAHALIEHIAAICERQGDPYSTPSGLLNAEDAGEILRFIANVRPLDPANFWNTPEDVPNPACGYVILLQLVVESIEPPEAAHA